MKTIIAGGVAAIALAVALPIGMASADHHKGGRHGGKGAHMTKMDGHDWHGRKGRHGMKMRRTVRMMEAMERFDADGDGSIKQEEVDAWRANRLAEFDADSDGSLSLEEYEALWLDAMRKRMVRRFQRHDSDGDGKITAEEFGERTRYMVMMRDRNEDGVLNMDDLKRGKDRRGRGRHKDGMKHGMRSNAEQGGASSEEEKSE